MVARDPREKPHASDPAATIAHATVAAFQRFVDAVGGHRCANILFDPSHFVLQQLDYAAFIDLYHERIKAFHVKDVMREPGAKPGEGKPVKLEPPAGWLNLIVRQLTGK